MPEPQVTVRITGETTQLQGALTGAEGKMRSMGKTLNAIGIMQAGAAFSALGSKITNASNAMVGAFASAEQGMAKVNTLLGAGVDAQALFGDEVERLATTIPVMGGELEVLDGLYQTISAGIRDTSEATQFLSIAMKAGVAGVSDTKTAVDALSTVIMSYGMKAEDATYVSDILFTTINQGKTTFAELAPQLGRVTSIAASAGVKFEELAGAIATATKAGISTDEAVTGLRQTILSFTKPSEEMKVAVTELGFASAAAMLQEIGLARSLRDLSQHTGGSTEAMSQLFPNVRALTVALPLAGEQADMLAADIDSMSESAGVAEEAFGIMANTTASEMAIMNNKMDEAKQKFGELLAPTQLWVDEMKVGLLETLSGINPELGELIGGIIVVGGEFFNTMGPMMQFAGSMAMIAFTVGISKKAMMGLGLATVAVGAIWVGLTTDSIAIRGAMAALTAAVVLYTLSKWAATSANLAFLASMGPAGWVLLGGAIAGIAFAIMTVSDLMSTSTGELDAYTASATAAAGALGGVGAGAGAGVATETTPTAGEKAVGKLWYHHGWAQHEWTYGESEEERNRLRGKGYEVIGRKFSSGRKELYGDYRWYEMHTKALEKLERGGITTGITPALLHPDELVLPLDRAKDVGFGGGDTYYTINITVPGDRNDEILAQRVAKVTMQEIRRAQSRTFKM